MVVVTGHSEKNAVQKHTYKGMQQCKGTRDTHDAVVPLEFALAADEKQTNKKPTNQPTSQKQNKKLTVLGISFGGTVEHVPHWPRLDVCRPRCEVERDVSGSVLFSERKGCVGQGCLRFCAVQWAERLRWSGMSPVLCCSVSGKAALVRDVSGSVLFSDRKGCVGQADDVVFLPLLPCCGIQSQSMHEVRKKGFQLFTSQLPRYSTKQRRQPKQSDDCFVYEYIYIYI